MAVSCLGKTFETEEERKAYFKEELRKLLPELRKLEGFPSGSDEDILALSDPPYFTLCPNPWLQDFIAQWEKEKEQNPNYNSHFTVSQPYATDVSEGKNNPIYNAHTYHTKVPHKAIMRYILHYTQPGDIILDGFAGTGMTGVAAQFCEKPDAETKAQIEDEFRRLGLKVPQWGKRHAICSDLSPIASFIAYNLNMPTDAELFAKEAQVILEEVEKECSWLYETQDEYGKGRINYVVWSDIFRCPGCNTEMVFWEVAVDQENGKVKDSWPCPKCSLMLSKDGHKGSVKVEKATHSFFDKAIGEVITQVRSIPVLINYTRGGKRYEKKPDAFDFELLERIEAAEIPYWFPTDRMPEGDESRRNDREGITHVHHFYTKRNLWVASVLYNKLQQSSNLILKIVFNSIIQTLVSKLVRYNLKNRGNGSLSGTLYVPSLNAENHVLVLFRSKLNDFLSIANYLLSKNKSRDISISTQSLATNFSIPSNSIDYIFTDPPFGSNIMYSELNFIWESWLKVKTNNQPEAIINKTQNKDLEEYFELMKAAFKEYYRVLKPGKWMTVEFSNTRAAIWNSIQSAIQRAGFVIISIATLDKQQGSFKAVTTPTAVKQDLILSCYKPVEEIEKQLLEDRGEKWVESFVEDLLEHLPIIRKNKNEELEAVAERHAKILYDKLVIYCLSHHKYVPLDAKEFQELLAKCFEGRDGYYFTVEQAKELDKFLQEANQKKPKQGLLFVTNEKEGVLWLEAELSKGPQKVQDLLSEWRKVSKGGKNETIRELEEILADNFIQMEDGAFRLPTPEEAIERDKRRYARLEREAKKLQRMIKAGEKLKQVRRDVVQFLVEQLFEAGKFAEIVEVSKGLPKDYVQEDELLFMYYEISKQSLQELNLKEAEQEYALRQL
ncbi:MAG: DNA methyltransferase [Bacteroidia bacterium]|nr:DNA methyltransferase [Bacteroidia bacterium]MDW8158450.1 DNA methyltransferase [Bacteroidia bacterium]